jgi:hypothetical protein
MPSAQPFQALVKAGDVTSGFLEGVMDLPVDGFWLVFLESDSFL